MPVDLKLVEWITANKSKFSRDEIIERLKKQGHQEQDIIDSYEQVVKRDPLITPRKSMFTTVILNLLVPGIGNIYLGKYVMGVVLLFLYVLSWIFNFTLVGMIVGMPLLGMTWLIALITGISGCKRINRGELP